MKKIMLIISLSLVIMLTSCSTNSIEFIDDDSLNQYGVIELKNIISSDVYYTKKFDWGIESNLYYNNDIEVQTVIEDIFEMLQNEELYSYCGYVPGSERLKSNKTIKSSTNLEDYYVNDNDMNEDSMTLTSCSFIYKLNGDDTVYELEVTSKPETWVYYKVEFNVVIRLNKRPGYICE